ncbi:MAG: hypothetical protein M3072_12745 [Candidatus Dormibacteraeota bacterium]|nr:hypothetical protein [Candidatus Dormibacteraeota bacterium]
MPRVVHHRFHRLSGDPQESVLTSFKTLAAQRPWRGEPPWLASDRSTGLFEMEFLRHVRAAEGEDVTAAGFLKSGGDETDVLVLMLFLRDLSANFGLRVTVRDEDNPFTKLRYLDFRHGLLPSGDQLEDLLARRPVIKRVDGQSIHFYPPAHREGAIQASRPEQWGYALCGLRAYAPTLLEAEQEALKILRALGHLGRSG